MIPDDGWDWGLLLYVATVLLRRSELQFWRMTPRKLSALTKAHAFVNGNDEQADGSADGQSSTSDKPVKGFIDQVIF